VVVVVLPVATPGTTRTGLLFIVPPLTPPKANVNVIDFEVVVPPFCTGDSLPSTAEVIMVVPCSDSGIGADLGTRLGGRGRGCGCCCNNGFEIGIAALTFNEDNSPEYEEKATVRIKSANSTSFFSISIIFLYYKRFVGRYSFHFPLNYNISGLFCIS
jgi:hypothetical protein